MRPLFWIVKKNRTVSADEGPGGDHSRLRGWKSTSRNRSTVAVSAWPLASATRQLARDLLGALGHAHKVGIVHRDVKPDNIVLGPDGAVLVDFGIARAVQLSGSDRVTRSGIAVGTSAYMSPEQISAVEDIDHRTDLYAMGCLLFECLVSRPPYVHKNENVVLQMHRLDPIPDLKTFREDVPDDLVRMITRALAKNREERWSGAGAMVAAMVE